MKNPLQYFDIEKFGKDLILWYETNKRDLPWRHDRDPYKIWVSEVMLQQTQVDTVIPYFERFMNQFPTIHDLAIADEQTVLKAWEGLGYYRRARHLLEAAREVVSRYHGHIPSDPKKLAKLKGIGPYTKGAILSIAFGQPEPAVDGNVMRVISRILTLKDNIAEVKTRKLIETYVRQLISMHDPSSFNQGLMELGALICKPKKPVCLSCPVQSHCQAFQEGLQEELPVKIQIKNQKKLTYVALMIRSSQGEYVIEKRPDDGLLANLWQFPMVPMDEMSLNDIESYVELEYGLRIQLLENQGHIRHVFTHLIWHLEVYEAILIERPSKLDQRLKLVSKSDVEAFPFPVSHQKMMSFLK